MTTSTIDWSSTVVVAAGSMTELVRGTEQAFVAWLAPLVRRHSITLDLTPVTRIDAGGIAALLALRSTAESAGNHFTLTGLAPHVAEMLALVGLSGVFSSRNMACASHDEACFRQPAA